MKNKKAIVLMWVLALLPAALLALAWSHLPQEVPLHWGLDGQVDRWGSPISLWWLCAVGPVTALLFQLLPRLDPKRENYEKFQGKYETAALLLQLLMVVAMGATLSESLWPGRLNVYRVICMAVGGMFLLLGNLMGKVKTNWFFGFRTPWALADPDVWTKTQRLGGWVFFLSGGLLVLLALLAPPALTLGMFLAVLLGGVGLTYYKSWRWFREKEDRTGPCASNDGPPSERDG